MKHSFRAFFLFSLCLALLCMPALLGTVWATEQGSEPAPPSVVQLDALADQYGEVTFNHEMHTYIAKGCGDCHHQHNTTLSKSCLSCHDLDASVFRQSAVTEFIACRNCHGDYSPAMPSMPGLKVAYHKKCFGCHVGIGELGESPKACAKTCHAPRTVTAR
jgi:hypothetical protein